MDDLPNQRNRELDLDISNTLALVEVDRSHPSVVS